MVNLTVANAAQGLVDLMGSLDQDEARGATVVRTILELTAHPNVPGVADGQNAMDIAKEILSITINR